MVGPFSILLSFVKVVLGFPEFLGPGAPQGSGVVLPIIIFENRFRFGCQSSIIPPFFKGWVLGDAKKKISHRIFSKMIIGH